MKLKLWGFFRRLVFEGLGLGKGSILVWKFDNHAVEYSLSLFRVLVHAKCDSLKSDKLDNFALYA